MNQNSPDKNNIFGGLLKGLQRKVAFRVLLVLLTIILAAVLLFSLTAAWQINVVQTSGLSFSAESWNFNGEVLLEELNVVMTPGDSGVIPLTLKNDSQSLVAASITVSKAQMIDKAKNRIFFYIDTQINRNGETIDKVYISSKKSYTYTIFPFSEVVIGEHSRNQARLNWEWVYDNLGYYVLGYSLDNGGLMVEDYISPITYNYDELLTTFDEHGELETIDGIITVAEFLETFSANDGYEGTIDVTKKTKGGYYPVSVDSNGYGVWAYLCSYSEIQKSIADDTEWGNENTSFGNVNFMIVGQNSREEGLYALDERTFFEAISDTGVSIVTLNNDIVLTQPIVSEGSSMIMVDLNGNTISSTSDPIVNVKNGGKVLFYNGTIEGVTQKGYGIKSIGGEVTLDKVTMNNVASGVVIFDDYADSECYSSINLVDCDISALFEGLWIYGKGANADGLTEIVIENSKIHGDNTGIMCNGSYYGSDIDIIGSEITGGVTSIYFPQKESYLTINNSILSGESGILVKGGYVAIIDSTITGTGAYQALPEDPEKLNGSGCSSPGDGVYLEANYRDRETIITISGSKTQIKGTDNGTMAVRLFPEDDVRYGQAQIKITGGTYSTDVTNYLEEGYVCTLQNGMYVVTKANA